MEMKEMKRRCVSVLACILEPELKQNRMERRRDIFSSIVIGGKHLHSLHTLCMCIHPNCPIWDLKRGRERRVKRSSFGSFYSQLARLKYMSPKYVSRETPIGELTLACRPTSSHDMSPGSYQFWSRDNFGIAEH